MSEFPEPHELARSGDPSPSHDAAREIIPNLPARHAETLERVRRHPGKTTNEIAVLEDLRDPREHGRRTKWLADHGLIVSVGIRRDTLTNRNAETWKAADGPQSPSPSDDSAKPPKSPSASSKGPSRAREPRTPTLFSNDPERYGADA